MTSSIARAFHETGADAILVDGLKDLCFLKELRVELNCLLMFHQITGAKSPPVSLEELARTGVSLINYSTLCLFAAQAAIDVTMLDLKKGRGFLVNCGLPPRPCPTTVLCWMRTSAGATQSCNRCGYQ